MITHEFITGPLPAGQYREVFFGGPSGDFTRIKFVDEEEWVGVFQRVGQGPFYKSQVFIFGKEAVVLVGGVLYRIDLATKILLSTAGDGQFQDIIADTELIFAAGFTTIHVMQGAALVKIIEGYYFDGFTFENLTPEKVYCSFFQIGGDWTGLIIDRRSLTIIGK
jgi:hypothetical protein